jgi:hypothetical protein
MFLNRHACSKLIQFNFNVLSLTNRSGGRVIFSSYLTIIYNEAELSMSEYSTRPSYLVVLVYTPTQNTNSKRNWEDLNKI